LEGKAMKTNDYVRFLIQTFVEHFETPKEERNKNKQRLPVSYQLFGILPYSVKESVKMIRKRKN
jgi:hypothetical protein